jgi:hypothetical protein
MNYGYGDEKKTGKRMREGVGCGVVCRGEER